MKRERKMIKIRLVSLDNLWHSKDKGRLKKVCSCTHLKKSRELSASNGSPPLLFS